MFCVLCDEDLLSWERPIEEIFVELRRASVKFRSSSCVEILRLKISPQAELNHFFFKSLGPRAVHCYGQLSENEHLTQIYIVVVARLDTSVKSDYTLAATAIGTSTPIPQPKYGQLPNRKRRCALAR